jgi:hypothetical protein
MLCGEAANTNGIGYGLTWLGIELMIYHTWGEHTSSYTTELVYKYCVFQKKYSHSNFKTYHNSVAEQFPEKIHPNLFLTKMNRKVNKFKASQLKNDPTLYYQRSVVET